MLQEYKNEICTAQQHRGRGSAASFAWRRQYIYLCKNIVLFAQSRTLFALPRFQVVCMLFSSISNKQLCCINLRGTSGDASAQAAATRKVINVYLLRLFSLQFTCHRLFAQLSCKRIFVRVFCCCRFHLQPLKPVDISCVETKVDLATFCYLPTPARQCVSVVLVAGFTLGICETAKMFASIAAYLTLKCLTFFVVFNCLLLLIF